MKKIKDDGTVSYYYYKKKIGRHKKTGKKKQPKKRGRSWQKQWNYKVVQSVFNTQTKFLGVYHDLEEIESVKEKLIKQNESVVLPMVYTTTYNGGKNRNNNCEYKNEYLFLEKTRVSNCNVTKIRNEYGKLVNHTTSSENWVIYDKLPYLIEETFWVYGYNPHCERKDVTWIYTNLLKNYIEENKNITIQIFAYKNKLIIYYDSDEINLVICKNSTDCIRLYNKIKEIHSSSYKKNKWCIFMGYLKAYSLLKNVLGKIKELTGWKLEKITYSTT